MATLVQLSEAIESGKIRFSGSNAVVEAAAQHAPLMAGNGSAQPAFNHKNPADWLHKRAGNTEYLSLLRKCE